MNVGDVLWLCPEIVVIVSTSYGADPGSTVSTLSIYRPSSHRPDLSDHGSSSFSHVFILSIRSVF